MDCGELSLVIPEYLETLFPVAAKGTALENSRLLIQIIPGLAECDACDEIFNVVDCKGICPMCGGFEKTILQGGDLMIREIRVGRKETQP